MNYYLVAPTSVIRQDHDAFTYHSLLDLPVGSIVRISLGKKIVNGVIKSKINSKPKFQTKEIVDMLSNKPLPQPLILLSEWLSNYYSTHLAIVLQTILPSGLHKKRRQSKSYDFAASRERTKKMLNDQQSGVIATLDDHKSGTFLLHGVTGSGKTQVYIELAKKEYSSNKSSIILVPEIALTPQLFAEFKNHFPNIIITHSGMTDAQRHLAWVACLDSAKPVIVIGPRSALFMPVHNLGLIVVDECHEPSYKQEQSPKYSALRAATMLAKFHKDAKVILGSASPSITDYFLAKNSPTPILELTKTAIQTIKPQILSIDLKDKSKFKRHRFFSDALLSSIDHDLKNKKQVLIFHNRRGTAPLTLCQNCGWSAPCQNCIVPMTFHSDKHKLICHLCGEQNSMPPNCPECGHPDVIIKGIGTKLIESELLKLFPNNKIARFDADNSKLDALQSRYQELYSGEIEIIIGTQLLAKGLDLPNLGTVGVIQADTGLHMPDYQSEERVFQLIYQVMGRVGRGIHESKAIIQTYQPDNEIVQAAINKDYYSFYEKQLKKRRQTVFPPFVHLLKLTCSYKTEAAAIQASRKMATEISQKWPQVIILGPTPAFYEKIGQMHRWQLIIKSKKRSDLNEIALSIPPKWQADLDPANIM